MKMKPEHYQILKDGFEKVFSDLDYTATKKAYADKGLSETRFRWDMYWYCKSKSYIPERFFVDTLYQYLNDTHIDTALKSLIKEFEERSLTLSTN